jgi:hypothetical protein
LSSVSAPSNPLRLDERVHYRDRFRAARYAALADAEGFGAICFALEALGIRLLGKQATLERYKPVIADCALQAPVLSELATSSSSQFKPFDALFRTVQTARNDAMHIGAYARHATEAAIQLCLGLEDALMVDVERTVGNVMVTSTVCVAPWQLVAHARQLMLMHSFSFLPVHVSGQWHLLSELGLAKFLSVNGDERKTRLGMTIEKALLEDMVTVKLNDADLLRPNTSVSEVLQKSNVQAGPMLWLIVDEHHPKRLEGVLSPFELM